jgi:hypothetical protein
VRGRIEETDEEEEVRLRWPPPLRSICCVRGSASYSGSARTRPTICEPSHLFLLPTRSSSPPHRPLVSQSSRDSENSTGCSSEDYMGPTRSHQTDWAMRRAVSLSFSPSSRSQPLQLTRSRSQCGRTSAVTSSARPSCASLQRCDVGARLVRLFSLRQTSLVARTPSSHCTLSSFETAQRKSSPCCSPSRRTEQRKAQRIPTASVPLGTSFLRLQPHHALLCSSPALLPRYCSNVDVNTAYSQPRSLRSSRQPYEP